MLAEKTRAARLSEFTSPVDNVCFTCAWQAAMTTATSRTNTVHKRRAAIVLGCVRWEPQESVVCSECCVLLPPGVVIRIEVSSSPLYSLLYGCTYAHQQRESFQVRIIDVIVAARRCHVIKLTKAAALTHSHSQSENLHTTLSHACSS